MIPPDQWKTQTLTIPGDKAKPEMVFDYPRRYGGTMSDELPESSAESNSFGIKTG